MRYSKKYIIYNFLIALPFYFIVGILSTVLFINTDENEDVFFTGFLGIDTSLELIIFILVSFVIYAIIAYFVSVLIWKKIRYSFEDSEIIFEKGIILKRNIKLNYERIHSVTNERTLFLRLFGLARLAINSGNTGSLRDEVIIIDDFNIINGIENELNEKKQFLKEKRIKDKAANLVVEESNPNFLDIKFDKKTRKEYSYNSLTFWIISFVFLVCYFFLAIVYLAYQGITIPSFFISIGVYILLVLGIKKLFELGMFLKYYNFNLKVEKTKITLTYGFFTIHKIAIDKNRIKAVILEQNIIQKKNGYGSLLFRVIGLNNQVNSNNENIENKDRIIPFFEIKDLDKYLKFLDIGYKNLEATNFSRKDSFRFYIGLPYIITSCFFAPFLLFILLYNNMLVMCLIIFFSVYLLTLLTILICRKIQYKNQGFTYDNNFLCASSGVFVKKTYIIKWHNVISINSFTTYFRIKKNITSIIIGIFSHFSLSQVGILMMDYSDYEMLLAKLKK